MARAPLPIPSQIIEQASSWFVEMREPSISLEQHEAFAQWLRASPVHVGVYLEVAKLWGEASKIDSGIQADVIGEPLSKVVPLVAAQQLPHPPSTSHDTSADGVQAARRPLRIAAAVLVGVLSAAGAWWYADGPAQFVADVGEQRVITLDDGSTVRLNSSSAVSVQMSPDQRAIELLKGQALFDVAQDKVRPFLVRSGDLTIKALGTQFDVNRKRSGTVVTVVNGRVALLTTSSATVPPSDQDTVLAAGEQAKIAKAGAIKRTPKANTRAATSWLQQELIFEDQPMSDVVEELNRYTRTPIVLSDPTLASLRVNAVFHTTSPDSFLRYVERLDGVRIERLDNEIRLTMPE